ASRLAGADQPGGAVYGVLQRGLGEKNHAGFDSAHQQEEKDPRDQGELERRLALVGVAPQPRQTALEANAAEMGRCRHGTAPCRRRKVGDAKFKTKPAVRVETAAAKAKPFGADWLIKG